MGDRMKKPSQADLDYAEETFESHREKLQEYILNNVSKLYLEGEHTNAINCHAMMSNTTMTILTAYMSFLLSFSNNYPYRFAIGKDLVEENLKILQKIFFNLKYISATSNMINLVKEKHPEKSIEEIVEICSQKTLEQINVDSIQSLIENKTKELVTCFKDSSLDFKPSFAEFLFTFINVADSALEAYIKVIDPGLPDSFKISNQDDCKELIQNNLKIQKQLTLLIGSELLNLTPKYEMEGFKK